MALAYRCACEQVKSVDRVTHRFLGCVFSMFALINGSTLHQLSTRLSGPYQGRRPASETDMRRITITIDDEQLRSMDRLCAERGYSSRSEGVRDLSGCRRRRPPSPRPASFGEGLGWFGSIRFRYFGPRPLIEDNSVRSRLTALVNGRVGYNFNHGFSLSLDVLSLTTPRPTRSSTTTGHGCGGAAEGVANRHFHPVEPTAVRLTLSGRF